MKEKKQNLHGKGKGRVLNFTKKTVGFIEKGETPQVAASLSKFDLT